MSHVDISTLHEYLDGELGESRRAEVETHVAECADCRDRLDQARAASQKSSRLLAELEPGPLEAPAWHELEDRAAARSRATSRRSHWPRLAWAASIALAFAIGWIAREDWARLPSPAEVSSSEVQAPAPEMEEAVSLPGTAGEFQAAGEARAAGRDNGAGAAEPEPAGFAHQREAARQEAAPVAGALEGARLADVADKAAADEAADMAQLAELAESRVTGDGVEADAPAADRRGRLAANETPTEGWIDALARDRAYLQKAQAELRADLADDARLAEISTAAAPLFTDVQPADAETRLNTKLRGLPDLKLVRIEFGPGAAVPGAEVDAPIVRAIYEDAAGQELVLIQQPVTEGREKNDADLPAFTVSPSGRTAYRWRDADGYFLMLIGHVSADSLRALADRVR